MDKKCVYKKLRRKPKPLPPSDVKRCKITLVCDGDSPDHCNTNAAATAASSRSDILKKNSFTNSSSLNNDLPQDTAVKTYDNALLCKVNEKIVNNTLLNQDEQKSTCNKLDNLQANVIFDSPVNEHVITSTLGDKLLPTSNNLSRPKNCIAKRMTEAYKNSSVNSKVIDCNTDELCNKKLSENVINATVSLKKDVTDKSLKLMKETTKEDHCIPHKVTEKDCELLKESSKFKGTRMSLTKPFSRVNKSYLDKIRASAYDEDGNLNLKKLTLRDFIYFNPPNNPMVGNDHPSKDEGDISDYIESSCDEETEATVAVPQLKVDSRGNIVLDHKSLTIPSSTDKKLSNLKKSTVVQENELSDRYKIKNRRKEKQNLNELDLKGQQTFSKIWTLAETLKFYKVIDEFGLDFSLMMEEFPYRTRKQLKRKYLYEDKVRRKYVDAAMKKRDSVDFEALEKELTKKQLRKDKEEELIIKKAKYDLHQDRLDIKNSSSKSKVPTIVDYIDPDGKGYRPLSESTLKIKRMKSCIRELKSKYLEETGKNKNSLKDFCKNKKQSVNNGESLMFDLSIPLYKELFDKKEEVKFINLIECADDLNLFIRLASEMFPNLGKDWRAWVKEIVANKILNKETDCEDEDVRSVALEIKSTIEQQKTNEKLESCYQLFSDPFDHVDPIESDKI